MINSTIEVYINVLFTSLVFFCKQGSIVIGTLVDPLIWRNYAIANHTICYYM